MHAHGCKIIVHAKFTSAMGNLVAGIHMHVYTYTREEVGGGGGATWIESHVIHAYRGCLDPLVCTSASGIHGNCNN